MSTWSSNRNDAPRRTITEKEQLAVDAFMAELPDNVRIVDVLTISQPSMPKAGLVIRVEVMVADRMVRSTHLITVAK